ncbi:hypothetical protein MTBLM5_30011 [Magnetospirillum sp. LM-5]|uniref:hypothetical protein n=1 Tax=Magnetospirillum sp. LM-5 TaxID=2681466 RepID=UPI00138456C7|nr:hypothetical protein [Magnetospirillum sp. LM-5]CAA7619084.1 hypothetical protein MTBLM5_30011 [Magnetospirillum sp. LM-5]
MESPKVTNCPAPEFTLPRYRAILASALQAGYSFIDFPSLAAAANTAGPTCALRHDCDNSLTAALRMARLEAGMGICSTYFVMLRSAMYNLLAKPNSDIVREILSLGHHLGLHYDYSAYGPLDANQIAAHCEEERALLSTLFGQPVPVVSFHQPTAIVLENQVRLLCLNVYDRDDTRGFTYISDSNMTWREGCPSAWLGQLRHPKLQLLVHPEWWTTAPMTIEEKWKAMLQENFAATQSVLLATERSYQTPLRMSHLP